MLIINYNELNHREQQKKKSNRHHRGRQRHYCCHLFCNKTTKKRQRSPFICSKAIEEGDGSCHLLLFQYNRTTQERKKKVHRKCCIAPQKKKKRCHLLCSIATKEKKKGTGSNVAIAFFVAL